MVVPLILPVSSSIGAVPETKTRPAALTAWLYVGDGFAALDVKTIWRAIVNSFGTPTEMCELSRVCYKEQPRIGISYLAGPSEYCPADNPAILGEPVLHTEGNALDRNAPPPGPKLRQWVTLSQGDVQR